MIFVTVGTQLPFDRMLSLVDQYLEYNDMEVYAQIGESKYIPKNYKFTKYLSREEFTQQVTKSEAIISHAGMGTIISAHDFSKPFLGCPRQLQFGEHRNDHQLATMKKFSNRKGIYFFNDYDSLSNLLNNLSCLESCESNLPPSNKLINHLNTFINN